MALKLKPAQFRQIALAVDVVLMPVIAVLVGLYVDSYFDIGPWASIGLLLAGLVLSALALRQLQKELNENEKLEKK